MTACKHWQVLVATLAAFTASTALAQNTDRGTSFRTGGVSANDPMFLLASPSVQQELQLSADQKAGFLKLHDEEQDRHLFAAGFIGHSPDQIQARLDQYAKENRDRLQKILTPRQTERLNEINLQVAGVAALGFDDVAKKLELTADQQARLKSIGDDARRQLAELNAPLNGRPVDAASRPAYTQKLNEIRSAQKTQAAAVLTAEQQAKFEQLQGKKFDTTTIQPNSRNFSRRGRIEAPRPPVPAR
jgi:Spy/CpxP family protein refolding chaperone